MHPTDSFELQE